MAGRSATGVVFAAALWFAAATLSIPAIFDIGAVDGLPFALLFGAAIGLTRLRSLLRNFAIAMLLAVIIIAYTPLIAGPAQSLIRRDPLPRSADAIVVLSAGVTSDGFLSQQGIDRLLYGAKLIKAGSAPRLIVTREFRSGTDERVSSAADQDSLLALAGIPGVIAIGPVTSTHDEAVAVARVALAGGWKRVILVTSPFHARRACLTFEHVGLAVSCAPAQSRDIAVMSLDSVEDRLGAFGMWLYELAGTIRYWQLGYI